MNVLDHPLISERYFFPRRDEPKRFTEIRLEPEVTLKCIVGASPTSAPALLHFHGNGEVVADYEDGLCPAITEHGLSTWFSEYRGYGGSSGTPQLGAMLDDADAVMQMASANGAFVYGRSVGSIYALHAAYRHPDRVRGLILESGIADVLERLLLRMTPQELGVSGDELREAVATHADQCAKLKELDVPLLVLHATGDRIVSVDHARALYEASPSKRKRIIEMPNGGHNTIWALNGDAMNRALHEFITTNRLS